MTSGAPPAPAGLAAERTALAWQRTALALGANGALLLVRSPLGGAAGAVVAAAAFALAGCVALLAARRGRSLAGDPAQAPVPASWVLGLAVAVACLAVGEAVAVLLAA